MSIGNTKHLNDRCRYVLPLDEYGDAILPVFNDKYRNSLEQYLVSTYSNEEERDLKRLFFNLRPIKKLVRYTSYKQVDKYYETSENIKAMHDLYDMADKLRKSSNLFNEASIAEAKEMRRIYQEAISIYGSHESGQVKKDYHIAYGLYKIICYMRDHDVNEEWCAFLTGNTDSLGLIKKIYKGVEYSVFKNMETQE